MTWLQGLILSVLMLGAHYVIQISLIVCSYSITFLDDLVRSCSCISGISRL